GRSHQRGGRLLGSSGHVARCLVGRPQRPGCLLTEVGEEGVVVGAGPERTLLQLVDPALQLTLALTQRRELLPDPAEERPYLGGVEPAEARGERVPREVLGRGARIRRDDDAAVVGHCAEAYDSRTRSLRTPLLAPAELLDHAQLLDDALAPLGLELRVTACVDGLARPLAEGDGVEGLLHIVEDALLP